ncbi:MAG: hypothetical protein NUV31_10540, partial [Dehalococcoidales bacterium]|nr:hypothetical protein [Dehalococcoidales bacterium]
DISVTVNGQPLELSDFPRDFVANTVVGAAKSLKGVDKVEKLELTLNYGKIKMTVNDQNIPLTPFPTLILARTLIAMVSTLKGVAGEVNNLEIKLKNLKS